MGALRLYSGGSPVGELTLRDALERLLLPTLDQPSSSTVQQLRRAVSLFEEWEQTGQAKFPGNLGCDTGTISTGVKNVSDTMLAAFRGWCLDERQQSPATWNKTWRRIRQILRRVGPAERGNPGGLGLIPVVPHIRFSVEPKRGKRIVGLEELQAWYLAAEHATWPDDGQIVPARQWRTLLVLGYCTGLRTRDATGLAASAVVLDPHCPDPEVNYQHPHGWLTVAPAKTRRHGREVVLPLPECLSLHLRSLVRQERRQVFTFGASNKHFARQWKEIGRRAGVKPFWFGDLRKTANTAYSQLRPGLGKWILGHAPRGVNETFYLDVMPSIVRGVAELPLPPAFVDLADKPIDRQLRLF